MAQNTLVLDSKLEPIVIGGAVLSAILTINSVGVPKSTTAAM
jgi:hypothetical protein